MYNIAICDDENMDVERVRIFLKKFSKTHDDMGFCLESFQTSSQFLDVLEDKTYDIYFLDIYIDEYTGIELAKKIRAFDENGAIIFMTSSDEFYKEAFKLNAASYLEKPFKENEFFDALCKILSSGLCSNIMVHDDQELVKLPVKRVLYVESYDHYKKIVANDGASYMERGTMTDIYNKLGEPYFYMLNQRSVVNLTAINKLNSTELTMEDGKSFKVPRGSFRQIKEEFEKFNL